MLATVRLLLLMLMLMIMTTMMRRKRRSQVTGDIDDKMAAHVGLHVGNIIFQA